MDPTSFDLKMKAKQLEREAKKLQKEATKERNKAQNELKRGNRAAAQLYASNAVRYDQQATTMLQNCAAITGMQTDLRQAQITQQVAATQKATTKQMGKTVEQINLEKVSKDRIAMDALNSKTGAAHQLLTNGENQNDLDALTDDLLNQLSAENQVDITDTGLSIPTSTIPNAPMPSAMGYH